MKPERRTVAVRAVRASPHTRPVMAAMFVLHTYGSHPIAFDPSLLVLVTLVGSSAVPMSLECDVHAVRALHGHEGKSCNTLLRPRLRHRKSQLTRI